MDCVHCNQTRPAVELRPRRRAAGRRGVIAVIAMLFLVLFSCLALGFYYSTAVSAQISANERTGQSCQLAAESGLAFLRYQLSAVDVDPTVTPDKMLEEVSMQLETQMEGTGNLGSGTVYYDSRASVISIPRYPNESIKLAPGGPSFRVTMTAGGERVTVKVTGYPGAVPSAQSRVIQTEFVRTNKPSNVFGYAVAGRSKVQVAGAGAKVLGSPDEDGSILSTFNGAGAIVTGSGPIDGDLFVVGDKTRVTLGGGSVAGATAATDIRNNHIKVVAAPLFPYIDTTQFKSLAVNTWVSGASPQKNIRVPANSDPKFKGGDVVNGILYIESPNNVTFTGNATINGIIVFENKGNPSQNTLDFKGNVTPTTIPTTAEFDSVRAAAKGWSIAAPAAAVTMSGSVDGFLDGSLVANSVNLTGSADLHFTKGSIIATGNSPTLLQGKTVEFAGTGADNMPKTGVRFNAYFLPDLTTYREIAPD
jgi:hypothetical protein